MKTPRVAVSIVLSLALALSSNGCHNSTTSAPATDVGANTIASPPVDLGPNTTPENPIVTAALSADAERGGVVGTALDPRSLTPTQLRFGRPPKLDPSVTYQPDVIIMEHGDTALRSMDSNGMGWHFDANEPQVDQIREGAIVFATERCVGRVLQVQRNGSDVAVLLGPVQITDVIKRAHLVYNQPLDLNAVVAAPAPDLPVTFRQDVPKAAGTSPGTTPSGAPTAVKTGETTRHYRLESVTYAMVTTAGVWKPFRIASYDARGRMRQRYLRPMSERVAQVQPAPGVPPGAPAGIPTGVPAPPAGIGVPQSVDVTGMAVYPCLTGCGGFGVQLKYDRNGVKVYANAVFFLHNPSLHFNVDIDGGIRTVGITLKGAGGFQVRFELGADASFNGNIHQTGNVPFDISIPIGFPVPVAVHLIQSLELDTGFSARTSVLQAMITFQACCELSVGYFNGSWGGSTPNVSASAPVGNVSGISVGINSLAFGLRQEVLVGIGAFGFASGPYLALSTGISALKQASEAVDCRQATLSMDFSAGVGWTLPKPVVSVINFFLKALNVAPLPGSGSLLEMKPMRMVEYKGSLPHACAG